ncbi:hypothetical protein N7488_004582 [Penicillium malachiteum]|nr:hypothetical protein N7488_004582 [Penicillium malachiteum]
MPACPVLGILHFYFHSGVDILEISQPASTLWEKSLEFVSTIPGFQGLSWATIKDASPHQQIIALIQWESQYSWKLFQSSLGFSMMLGYISEIFNRCIQLASPIDISGSACHLELVSFGFSNTPSGTQLQRKAEFKNKWEMAFSGFKYITAETELISVCGEWLEKDNDNSENEFFVGLLFWKSNTEAHSPQILQESNVRKVEDHLESLLEDATGVTSIYTTRLNHVSSGYSALRPYDLSNFMRFETNHRLFKIPVKPKYAANLSANPYGKDNFHLESMRHARGTPPGRVGLAPAGIWYPMGVLSQHYLPPGRKDDFPANFPVDCPTNMKLISFFAQTGNEQVATSFADLRKKLWKLGDCPQLISKRQSLSKEEIDTHIKQYLQQLLNENGGTIQNLSHRKINGPHQLKFLQDMEIITCDVPANKDDCRAFEYAQLNFLHRGWVPGKPAETVQFTSMFSCNKGFDREEAWEEWYSDFITRARTEYDLLGHNVDWLRTLSRKINVQYIVFEEEDAWMTSDKLEKERFEEEAARINAEKLEEQRRADAVVPPSIFDIPWANKPNTP